MVHVTPEFVYTLFLQDLASPLGGISEMLLNRSDELLPTEDSRRLERLISRTLWRDIPSPEITFPLTPVSPHVLRQLVDLFSRDRLVEAKVSYRDPLSIGDRELRIAPQALIQNRQNPNLFVLGELGHRREPILLVAGCIHEIEATPIPAHCGLPLEDEDALERALEYGLQHALRLGGELPDGWRLVVLETANDSTWTILRQRYGQHPSFHRDGHVVTFGVSNLERALRDLVMNPLPGPVRFLEPAELGPRLADIHAGLSDMLS
jgi:hypothetical protein